MPRRCTRRSRQSRRDALHRWAVRAAHESPDAFAEAFARGAIDVELVRRDGYRLIRWAKHNLPTTRQLVSLLGPEDAAPFYAHLVSSFGPEQGYRVYDHWFDCRFNMSDELFELLWGRVFTAGMPAMAAALLLYDVCGNTLPRALGTLVAAGVLNGMRRDWAWRALGVTVKKYMRALTDADASADDWWEWIEYNQQVELQCLRVIAALLGAGVPPTRGAVNAMVIGTYDAQHDGIDFATPLARWYWTDEFEIAVGGGEIQTKWGPRDAEPLDVDELLSVHAPDGLLQMGQIVARYGARGAAPR